MMDQLFLVTYRFLREKEGEMEEVEEVEEVRACSAEQARFLAPCSSSDIINVECVIAKRKLVAAGR